VPVAPTSSLSTGNVNSRAPDGLSDTPGDAIGLGIAKTRAQVTVAPEAAIFDPPGRPRPPRRARDRFSRQLPGTPALNQDLGLDAINAIGAAGAAGELRSRQPAVAPAATGIRIAEPSQRVDPFSVSGRANF